ncbi:hypothetical protein Psch_03522 [Pelotomaculum schinkii]|uniref:Uncharacterized protein n=1 Tax=Pelotomaculum schinkii TaxID=78350 RepID=A0A4Y7R7Z7_9FIRM|nr:hypothetical protein [Pelotomaculum schinkii]TEB04760.1 hypothetical protein Psch_03522 [Pelotomaculum schinkii]
MTTYEVYKKDSNVLRIYYDESASNPRQDYDNFGTMICWHSRYVLGDKHNFEDKDNFLLSLLEEMLGNTYKAEEKYEKLKNQVDREIFRSYSAYSKEVDDKILDFLENDCIILPLYLYDHSGITMNTTGFYCPWDSGQVGWIYVTKEMVRREYGIKRITKKIREKVIQALKSEVNVYSEYLEGNVYGYVLEDAEGNELDSCWGFYGDNFRENGMADYVGQEWFN